MRALLLFAASLALAGSAAANDTTASTGAGGLILQRTDAIDLKSEDLFVSADEIRVRYIFRNVTPQPVDTIVAFPMPERDLAREYGGDVAFPSDFRTTVAGKPVKAGLERKAMVGEQDQTAVLQALGLPIAPDSIAEATRAMDALPAADRRRLVSLGIAGEEQYDDDGTGMKTHLIPLWRVVEKYWWRQRFPAGRDLVIEHRYVPGVGGSVESPVAFSNLRGTEEGRTFIARYCIDEQFLAAIDRLAGADPMQGPGMPDKRIDYVLTTGANWRSPIGSFRLVVDKGNPGNLVSFCETGVTKIGPTQFEVRHSNWRPTKDLHVLIIEPRRGN